MKFNRFSAVALLGICMMPLPMAALAYDTWPVSEEDPPAACDIGDAVDAARCYGSYCDRTNLSCANNNYPVSHRYWTTNFSEEGTNYRYCGPQEIMTGISCSGRYCDNVSIECSKISRTPKNCRWVGHSEEWPTTYNSNGDRIKGYVSFEGQHAVGMKCTGRYCDNHHYKVCNF